MYKLLIVESMGSRIVWYIMIMQLASLLSYLAVYHSRESVVTDFRSTTIKKISKFQVVDSKDPN